MARRKRAFLDDDSDSSNSSDDGEFDGRGFNEDPDARDERELFQNPYKRRKRTRTKEDEIYGVFGDEDEEARGNKPAKRLHFTQAPFFVTGEEMKVDADKMDEKEVENSSEEDEGDGEKEDEPLHESLAAESSVGHSTPEDGRIGVKRGPGLGGDSISFKAATEEKLAEEPSKSLEEPVSAPAAKGGISSGTLPTKFGTTSKRPSFVRDNGSAGQSRSSTPQLSLEERLHFSKISGTFGAKMLAKMGWQAGTGLGTTGEGIVTPVETKMRPKPSMGLAFKGFREKTEQSKAEARRRGEEVGEDEQEVATKKKKKDGKPKSDVWKKPKKAKVKVEYQTYEQILQDAGQETQPAIGKVYDATSGEMREISSLAGIASWTPSTDTMRIPEVRHNLRLIVDIAKGELDGLAREAKKMQDRKKHIEKEDIRLWRIIQQETELILRLQCIHLVFDEMKVVSQSTGDHEILLESFSPYIEKLIKEFAKEYDTYRLDEIVIAAIAPIVRQQLASWQPLKDPTLLVDLFSQWRLALKFNIEEEVVEDDPYGIQVKKQAAKELVMTPYESLMWNIWLPRVRTSINSEWSPLNPDPVIRLYKAWSTLLPPFIRDNMFDQLILPKVQNVISEWSPRTDSPSLESVVFPWLPHIGLRVEELISETKRRVKSMLRNWKESDEVPEQLLSDLKEVLGPADWTSILECVVGRLGKMLRENFRVNPGDQDMRHLQSVFEWRTVLGSSITAQLLKAEFFPKWLSTLYRWLTSTSDWKEVGPWYERWKYTAFPEDLRNIEDVKEGFDTALKLIDQAVKLGPDAASKLSIPQYPVSKPRIGASTLTPSTIPPKLNLAVSLTFKDLVEKFAEKHNLLFMPTGRVHEKSRKPLYRVSRDVDVKGTDRGLLVYVLDDAVWVVEGDGVRAISLDDMVLRANILL